MSLQRSTKIVTFSDDVDICESKVSQTFRNVDIEELQSTLLKLGYIVTDTRAIFVQRVPWSEEVFLFVKQMINSLGDRVDLRQNLIKAYLHKSSDDRRDVDATIENIKV